MRYIVKYTPLVGLAMLCNVSQSLIDMATESDGFAGTKYLLHELINPESHFLETKQFAKQLRFFAVFSFGSANMIPHTQVSPLNTILLIVF